MDLFKKIFSSGARRSSDEGAGFFLYVRCDHCGDKVRLHIYKEQELNRTEHGYVWHKTIIDNRCFRPIPTVVTFDRTYGIVGADIEGGHYISREEYESADKGQETAG